LRAAVTVVWTGSGRDRAVVRLRACKECFALKGDPMLIAKQAARAVQISYSDGPKRSTA